MPQTILTGASPSTSCRVSEANSIRPLEQHKININPLAACEKISSRTYKKKIAHTAKVYMDTVSQKHHQVIHDQEH